ncbi:hemolytic toxin Avt-1-like protein, partial [Dinothrombium tinctorium]
VDIKALIEGKIFNFKNIKFTAMKKIMLLILLVLGCLQYSTASASNSTSSEPSTLYGILPLSLFREMDIPQATLDEITQKTEITNCSRYFVILMHDEHHEFDLKSPSFYLVSGISFLPPPSTLRHNDLCLFCENYQMANGSAGVLSYEIHKLTKDLHGNVLSSNFTGNKLLFMWSISNENNRYDKVLAVGISTDKHPSQQTFEEMNQNTSPWFARKPANDSVYHKAKIDNIPIKVQAHMPDFKDIFWWVELFVDNS